MKKLVILLLYSLIFICAGAQTGLTPSQVLDKTIAVLSNQKGIEAKFSITNSGYTSKGEIVTASGKFKVKLPDISVWYNGRDLYTYNDNTGETTIVNPTSEELAESNPLAYVIGAQKNYNVTFSTVKKTGSYVLELTPKTKRSEVKRITLTVKKTDYIPERIVVEPAFGEPMRADITSFNRGIAIPSGEFEYPKNKYPKAEIIDLR